MKTKAALPELLPALLIFTRQFATLVQHGVSLSQCCVLLAEDAPSPYAETCDQLREQLESGRTLFEAMSVSDYLFPSLYLAMIRAGEVGVAGEAGETLTEILTATEEVNRQADQSAAAAIEMASSANELVAAVDTVSAVVEENTASTEEMAAGSTEVSESIESIAAVAQENSASVEEVSAATNQMSINVAEVSDSANELANLARQLQEIVLRFKLN